MIGKEGHTSSVGFFPKIYKSKLMNILQNISVSKSECKDLKKKKKKNAYHRLEEAKETREENTVGYPGLDLVIEKDISGKTGKI